jgi:hypothetical protein
LHGAERYIVMIIWVCDDLGQRLHYTESMEAKLVYMKWVSGRVLGDRAVLAGLLLVLAGRSCISSSSYRRCYSVKFSLASRRTRRNQ